MVEIKLEIIFLLLVFYKRNSKKMLVMTWLLMWLNERVATLNATSQLLVLYRWHQMYVGHLHILLLFFFPIFFNLHMCHFGVHMLQNTGSKYQINPCQWITETHVLFSHWYKILLKFSHFEWKMFSSIYFLGKGYKHTILFLLFHVF